MTQHYWKALQNNDLDRVRFLLERKIVTLRTRNLSRETSLQWAVKNAQTDMFDLLLEFGAKDTLQPAGKAFLDAMDNGRPDFAKKLIEQKRTPTDLSDIRDSVNNNVFHLAFRTNDNDLLVILFKKISLANSLKLFQEKNQHGMVAFDYLCQKRNTQGISIYLEHLQDQVTPDSDDLQRQAFIKSAQYSSYCFESCAAHIPTIELSTFEKNCLFHNIQNNLEFKALIDCLEKHGHFAQKDLSDVLISPPKYDPEVIGYFMDCWWESGLRPNTKQWELLRDYNLTIFSKIEKKQLDETIQKDTPLCKKEVKRI